jgi:hypothetical protein
LKKTAKSAKQPKLNEAINISKRIILEKSKEAAARKRKNDKNQRKREKIKKTEEKKIEYVQSPSLPQ